MVEMAPPSGPPVPPQPVPGPVVNEARYPSMAGLERRNLNAGKPLARVPPMPTGGLSAQAGQPKAPMPVFQPKPLNTFTSSLQEIGPLVVQNAALAGLNKEVVANAQREEEQKAIQDQLRKEQEAVQSQLQNAQNQRRQNLALGLASMTNEATKDNMPMRDLLMSADSSARGEPIIPAQQGGLIGLADSMDEFSGQVPGDGHGMEDNVRMPIVEEGEQIATLAVSPDEYVVDAYTMAALGNGSADEGAEVMDEAVKQIRKKAYGSEEQPNEINGLAALQPIIERV